MSGREQRAESKEQGARSKEPSKAIIYQISLRTMKTLITILIVGALIWILGGPGSKPPRSNSPLGGRGRHRSGEMPLGIGGQA